MFPVMDLTERNALRDNTHEYWERACALGRRGLHHTSIFEVLWSLVLSLILLPVSLLSYIIPSGNRVLNPRAVFVKEAPKKNGESLPLRNARSPTLITTVAGASTLRRMWEQSAEKYWNRPAILMRPVLREVKQKETYTKEDGSKGEREDTKVIMDNAFQSYTYGQIHERVCNVGSGLCVTLNQISGASRMIQSPRAAVRHIALYAETKGEWMITALACFRNNITVTTAYSTLGLDALAYSLDITDTRVIVTDENLLPQLVSIMDGRQFDDGGKTVQVDGSHLATIIYMPKTKESKPDAKALAALQNRSAAKGGPINVISFAELEKLGKQYITHEDEYDIDTGKIHPLEPGSSARIPEPKSTAMIMFTSGTTGLPKGVEMSHESVLSSLAGLGAAVPALDCTDVYIAYLPLAHILEVVAETALLSYGCSIGYSNPGTVTDTARAIPKPDPENHVPLVRGDASILRPTLMAGVPTMFERVRAAVLNNVRKKGGVLTSLFNFALKARLEARNRGSDTPFWNWLFFDRIRTQSLGGRIRLMLSGGGPLAADTEDFITTVFIAPIIQGYGLTETCAAGTINWPDDVSGGRVGPPVLCDDIKLVDWADAGYLHTDTNPRGEVYIGSKSISNGYYKQPEKTRESYFEDADGKRWFATGDIGEIMPGGVLRIIDRRKDLFKLAHGEYVAPSKVESVMSQSPLVEMSMLHADSTKDSCIAVVFVNRAAVEKALPEMNGYGLEAMANNAEVQKAVKADILRLCKERKLSRSETPSAVILSPIEWTPDSGLLTETLKIKRHAVVKQFRAQIEKAYSSGKHE